MWKILVFETPRGEKPVEEFIKSLDEETTAKIVHSIDLLEKHGPFLGMPHTRRLTRNVSEIRIRGKTEIRILYSVANREILLLHAFKKQTQKTPAKEIDTAIRRLESVK